MNRYTLVVKGADVHAALDRVRAVGKPLRFSYSRRADVSIIRVATDGERAALLNGWLTEDNGPPFRDGSLLYWNGV